MGNNEFNNINDDDDDDYIDPINNRKYVHRYMVIKKHGRIISIIGFDGFSIIVNRILY